MDYPSQILLVDDCQYNTEATMSLLQQFNLKVDTCNDGQSAILKVAERSPEEMYRLIIMDYSMTICKARSHQIDH